ncbi:MAG: hypothetical protein R3F61_26540 [Myxococcota bacterium]
MQRGRRSAHVSLSPLRSVSIALFALALALPAGAAEVVWLGPVTPEQKARVSALDGAGRVLDAWDVRAAGTDASAADDAAYARLTAALQEVRAYELKLDGELVIMADLQVPLDAISVVRSAEDRTALFRALTYQGFAVDRYFDASLASDPDAEPWRASLDSAVVERPWRDAAALDPKREVTPYEIAEAPQRVAYDRVREAVTGALPGGLRVEGVPEGALLRVDGEPRDDTASNLRVPPGRHYVHLERDGHILERWTVDLEPGSTEVLTVGLSDAVWQGFVRGLSPETPVPAELRPRLEALGGELWFAKSGPRDPVVFRVTPDRVEAVELPRERTARDDDGSGLSITGFVGGGWLSSGDFFLQEYPNAPETRGTVNSATLVPALGAAFDLGLLRVGAGVDSAFTPGAFHYARYGTRQTRLRPFPHVEVGTKYASITAGYLFPYHPMAGVRGSLPLPAGLEVRAEARAGLGSERALQDGSPYQIQPIYTAFASIGYRWRP